MLRKVSFQTMCRCKELGYAEKEKTTQNVEMILIERYLLRSVFENSFYYKTAQSKHGHNVCVSQGE